jgi:hypothetical protein
MKSEHVIEVGDGLLQVVHPSQLFKLFPQSRRQVSQQISMLDIPRRTLLKVMSKSRNWLVQSFCCATTPEHELASNEVPLH